ncbi:MAG: hypothetical protein KAX81_05440 [Leadbetterella sp.]|nr:hypothetical protein [Leadbetterella sp.]
MKNYFSTKSTGKQEVFFVNNNKKINDHEDALPYYPAINAQVDMVITEYLKDFF